MASSLTLSLRDTACGGKTGSIATCVAKYTNGSGSAVKIKSIEACFSDNKHGATPITVHMPYPTGTQGAGMGGSLTSISVANLASFSFGFTFTPKGAGTLAVNISTDTPATENLSATQAIT